MSIFSKKQEVNLEDFCSDFYEKNILNPTIKGVDFGVVYFETVKKSLIEVDQSFSKITSQKLASEIIPLRFELFALAWTHKFISGKIVVAQSAFTKRYLHEKGKDDIWNDMYDYNDIIGIATLDWLTKLGKINISFNHNMRKDLIAKNREEAEKMGLVIDESIDRVNNRVWSENSWRQKFMINPLVSILCHRLGVDLGGINKEAVFRLAVVIRGLYDGAKQSLGKIKIKN